MEDDKLRVVEKGNFSQDEKRRAEMLKVLRDVQVNWAEHLELMAMQAQLARAKYLAFLKEGFTEAQALELCRS